MLRNVRRRRLLIDALESRTLFASVANKLADINTTSSMLDPQNLTPMGTSGVTLFAGRSYHGDGAELWRSDGTAAGTYRLKDINPGAAGSDPSQFVYLNGAMYFAADDGSHGVELWKTDGTTGGTVLVKDIVAGSTSGAPANLIATTAKLFFSSGNGLWTSDGTEQGTAQVGPAIYSFAASRPFTTIGDSLYFGAVTSSSIAGIFKSDGTVGGTKPLKNFDTTVAPRELVAFNGHVYFNADTDQNNRGDLWMTTDSAGAAAGAVLVKSIGSALYSSVLRLTPSGNYLYFLTYEATDGTSQLWRTDGTGTNTVATSASTTLVDRYTILTAFGTNSILFNGKGATTGGELWRSDGSTPYLVKEVLPGTGSGVNAGPVKIGGIYYLAGYRADGGTDLWKTDGTTAGTVRIADLGGKLIWSIGAGPLGPLFSLVITSGSGELWKSDGTTNGTVRVGTSNARGNGSSMWDYWTVNAGGRAFTQWGTSVLFSADDGINGAEVWITNQQTGSTRMLADVNPGMGSSNPTGFTVASDNSVIFAATRADVGTELFRLLPSGSVQLVADLNPGATNSYPSQFSVFGNSVFYSARLVEGGQRLLHRFDVSTLTNTAIRNNLGQRLAATTALMTGLPQAFFGAQLEGSSSGAALYQLASPASTPTQLKSISASGSLFSTQSAVLGSTLYFVASDPATGYELWKTDGTISGTVLVKDINVGSGSAGIDELFVFKNRLYFAATTNSSVEPTLWSSDGTANGTTLFSPNVENPAQFTNVGGELYFTAPTSTGSNIFRTDGAAAPTPVVSDVTADYKPVSIYGTASSLFYVMQDRTTAQTRYFLRQFTSSGAVTTFVKDLWVYNPFDPLMNSTWLLGRSAFLALGDRLYFPAFRQEWGVEPHTYLLKPIVTTMSATLFFDYNRDGIFQDATERTSAGLSGYVDLDNDALHDADEPVAPINEFGTFFFRGLDYGTYVLRPLLLAGQTISDPAKSAVTLTISDSNPVSGPAIGVIKSTPPGVKSIVFDRNAKRMAVNVVFDDDIATATLSATDLTLTSLTTGVALQLTGELVSYYAPTRTATFTFPSYTNGILPDDRYIARFEAGVIADGFGNVNAAAVSTTFAVLLGDINGDATVDFNDLVILAQNYGQFGGKGISEGNVDYDPDGRVNFQDLVILARQYGKSLPPAAAPVLTATITPSGTKGRKSASDVVG